MSKFKMLTDEEITAIYNEAKSRTKQSLEYGKNRIIKERADEEKRYAEAKEKYQKDMEIYHKNYEEQYQRFLKQEEQRKKMHEHSEKSKIQFWESDKKSHEQLGIEFKCPRPQPTPFTPYKFTFYGTAPREPVKKIFSDAEINSCNEILNSFKNMYTPKDNHYQNMYDQYNFFGMDKMFDLLNSFYGSLGVGGFATTDLFNDELRKEKIVTDKNRNKIEYLTLREHFLTMRELQSCTSTEMTSDDPIVNGLYGEKLTVFELELMKMKNYKGKILFDLYIPTADGKYVQVDILFISPKGIFVIESKNYSGSITGNEVDEKWNTKRDYNYDPQYNYKRNRYKENGFYNPVKQNQKHIEAIQYHFKGIPCFSLIAFSERCKLESIKVSSKTAYVFNRYAMINVFSRIYNSNPDVLSDDLIKCISEHLQQFCDADDNVKKTHNDNIRDNVTHDYNNFEYFDDYGDYNG